MLCRPVDLITTGAVASFRARLEPEIAARTRRGVRSHTHAIQQFDLFGSILRDDFDSESDVDVLVTFKQGMTPSLFDRMKLERALSELFRRQVDLITMGAVTQSENALLRDEILSTRLTVYAE